MVSTWPGRYPQGLVCCPGEKRTGGEVVGRKKVIAKRLLHGKVNVVDSAGAGIVVVAAAESEGISCHSGSEGALYPVCLCPNPSSREGVTLGWAEPWNLEDLEVGTFHRHQENQARSQDGTCASHPIASRSSGWFETAPLVRLGIAMDGED